MRKMQQTITVNNVADFKVAAIYKAARKQQKTAQRKAFYVDEFAVSPSEWATAKMEGADACVSNASVKGSITRLVHKRGFNKRGFSHLLGKSYVVNPVDDVEIELVELDEILEVVPEVV